MGFFDDITATFNRGADAAGRTARTLKLKGQISDANKRRASFAAQLGAIMYERFKDDAAAREGCEELFAGIAACDEERAGYQAEIDAIEAEAAAASEAAKTLECPKCHTRVSGGDLFCSGCGMPVEEIKAAAAARAEEEAAGPAFCPKCGAPVGDDDLFCTGMRRAHRRRARSRDRERRGCREIEEPVPVADAKDESADSAEPRA